MINEDQFNILCIQSAQEIVTAANTFCNFIYDKAEFKKS